MLDVEAYAGERVARFLSNKEDVAYTGTIDVLWAEEAGARAGRVESGDLGGGDGSYRVGAGFAGGGGLRSNADFPQAAFEAWRVFVSIELLRKEEDVVLRFCLVA